MKNAGMALRRSMGSRLPSLDSLAGPWQLQSIANTDLIQGIQVIQGNFYIRKKSNKVSNSKARSRNNNNFQKCLDTLASLDPRWYH